MQKIEGVEIGDLVQEASKQILLAQKDEVLDLVKKLIQKAHGLTEDVKRAKHELKGKEDKLAKTLARIEKLRAGDWSALQEQQGEKKEQPVTE